MNLYAFIRKKLASAFIAVLFIEVLVIGGSFSLHHIQRDPYLWLINAVVISLPLIAITSFILAVISLIFIIYFFKSQPYIICEPHQITIIKPLQETAMPFKDILLGKVMNKDLVMHMKNTSDTYTIKHHGINFLAILKLIDFLRDKGIDIKYGA